MTISVKNIISQGTLPVGATVNFLDASGLIGSGSTFTANNSVFLRSGFFLSADASGTYPEAFNKLSINAGGSVNSVNNVTFPSSQRYNAGIYAKNIYVAVSGRSITSNIVSTSTDGASWTDRTMPASVEWTSVAYGNNTFVSVSGNSTASNAAATSPDGITWTRRNLPSSQSWGVICYGANLFVATAGIDVASTAAATSPDGITWTSRTLPVSQAWSSLVYGNSIFVLTARSNSTYLTSTDGITWVQRTFPVSGNIKVTFGNGMFLAVPIATTTSSYYVSSDGISWSQRSLPASDFFTCLNFGANIFCIVAAGALFYSSDLINWQKLTFNNTYTPQGMFLSDTRGVILPYDTTLGFNFTVNPILRVGIPAEVKANGTVLYLKVK